MKDCLAGFIFVLIGPSASGKTTLLETVTKGYFETISGEVRKVKEEYKPYIDQIGRIVTATTRIPRPGEIDGVHYIFKSSDEFECERAQDNLIGETLYGGKSYGILKSEIDRVLGQGINGIMALDINGVKSLKSNYGENRVVSIFIYRDISEIFEELKKRPWDEEEFFTRFEGVKEDLKIMPQCDEVVFNVGPIDEVVNSLFKIIKNKIDNK